jgi:hypothetical protein
MRLLAALIGWALLPFFAVGRLVGRLLPSSGQAETESREALLKGDWSDLVKSYNEASRNVVNWWLHGEGYTLDGVLSSERRRETARDLIFNLMTGVREGFVDPEFARCLAFALSCAVVQQRPGGLGADRIPSPAWPCEYCVFFKGLKEVSLPEPDSLEHERRHGNKLGECERKGPVTMREIPAGACDEFRIEKRKQLRLLKQTNEELQLWYLVYGRKADAQERARVLELRRDIKEQMRAEQRQRRRRRATDYSLR